ncbi:TPA: hypothetical protein ACMDRZ_003198 [Vibrio cholerae]|uniref:hypothetical protein n=1 Tax=Vibrio cholerae TaxID=666 RepID=UPI001582AFA6|nr:hypothetical protein [Vibrio cholerae]QKU65590.1 hypothetical protein HPY17_19925 [Vibrio cholerae]
MKYRLKHLSIFVVAALLAVAGVVAQQGGYSNAGLQFGESWIGYKIGLPLFSIIALLSLVRSIRGQQQNNLDK